ncbi:MAG: hypothetical protein CVU38_06915, partial [Chloroflexi bacterium HGW-Chloroflexi-1]
AELKDMGVGLWNPVTDPVGTATGLWYGITHPGELWDALTQPYVEAWESGHPWQAIGRGTVAIVTTVLGTKGADKVAKVLKGATIADDVARVGSVADDVGRVGSVAEDVGRVGSVVDDVGRVGSTVDDAGRVGTLADDAGRIGSVAEDAGRLIHTTGRVLSEAESTVAKMLANEGRVVEVVAEGTARTADFLVDGIPTELKTVSRLTSPNLSGALSRRILDGAGQAGHIIIDARGQAGLTQTLAERAIRRAYGCDLKPGRLQEIRMIGNGFDITVPLISP